MGVWCIVFGIDGILFEFFMNFLNIEKKIIWRFIFSIFHVFFAFHDISNIKKKNCCKKKISGGGGVDFFFLEKQFFLISRFMLFSTLQKNIKKYPFTYWLNGRWFLQIVERPSWNLYPLYPLFPCSDFVSQLGGGGCNVFLTFYAISNISRKTILGIQTNYFLFNVFFMFFLYAGNIEKCPFTYSYWLNGRWFLHIVHFIMRLEIFKSAPSLTG